MSSGGDTTTQSACVPPEEIMSPDNTRAHSARSTNVRRGIIGLASAALVAMAAWAPMAYATHYQQSLDGNGLQPASQFQIDNDANLTVEADVDAPFDWANVDQNVGTDLPTGQRTTLTRAVSRRTQSVPLRRPGASPTTSPTCCSLERGSRKAPRATCTCTGPA